MTQTKAEPQAITLLRDIIEGDDATMSRAIDDGKKLLHMLKISAATPTGGDDLDKIMALVAADHGYTVAMLRERNRTAHLVAARQMAMYLCRKITSKPLEEIGRRFARDHGTVIHAVTAIENRAATDAKFKLKLQDIYRRAAVLCGRAGE